MKMRQGVIAAAIAMVLASPVKTVLAADDSTKLDHFTIHAAVLAGSGQSQEFPTTILLHRTTGQTWMLVLADGKPLWVAVTYSDPRPGRALPPLEQD